MGARLDLPAPSKPTATMVPYKNCAVYYSGKEALSNAT